MCINEHHWRGYTFDVGGYGAVFEGNVQARAPGSGLAQADVRRDNGFGKGKIAGGGSIPPLAQ